MSLTNLLLLFASRERNLRIPQADEVERIGELIELVGLGLRDSDGIAKRMHFNLRQSSYYREAAEILGFLNPRKRYSLTDLGRHFLISSHEDRIRLMVCALLRNPIINDVTCCLRAHVVATVSFRDIEDLVTLKGRLRSTTIPRRTRTIMGWLRWLSKHYGMIRVVHDEVRLSL